MVILCQILLIWVVVFAESSQEAKTNGMGPRGIAEQPWLTHCCGQLDGHSGQPALCQAGCLCPAPHLHTPLGRGRKVTHLCLRFRHRRVF